jgi:hypothetical protein
MDRYRASVLVLAAAAGVGLGASDAGATELTFDINGIISGSLLSQNYGDRVASATMGNFSYGTDGGFTSNVVVDYEGKRPPNPSDEVSVWTTGYSDLANVVYYEWDGAPGFSIAFRADPGFVVSLAGLDMGNFGAARILPALRVLNAGGQPLFEEMNIAVPAGNQSHLSFTFPSNVLSTALTIDVDTTGLGGDTDNIGLDNIQFSQARRGDFNNDAAVNGADIDLLCDRINAGTGPISPFDVNGDGSVNQADVNFEVTNILGTKFGDTDTDGDVDLNDLGNLASGFGQPGEKRWSRGNFDCDNDVDLNDLGTLATNFGGGREAALAEFQALVPEPAGAVILAALFGNLRRRR